MANVPHLIPFRAEHLRAFIHRDGDYVESIRNAIDKETRGPAYTAVYNNRVIGCAGVMIQWPGVGAAWAVFSPDIAKFRIWTSRTVRRTLQDIIRVCKLHRVELSVLANNPRNADWAAMLGFTKENGLARCYTSNKIDVIRYELMEKN